MEDNDVPRFYLSNIHERRLPAFIARAVPLAVYLMFIAFLIDSALRYEWLLLFVCAALNVTMWIFFASMSAMAILGTRVSQALQEVPLQDVRHKASQLEEAQPRRPAVANLRDLGALAVAGVGTNCSHATGKSQAVQHLIVMPNFQEEEEMMVQTLEALSQAVGSEDFRVVLAMEAREGPIAQEKARRLKHRFACRFARVLVSTHPDNLMERHADGSVDNEVVGKAANLKWAVAWAYQELSRKEPALELSSVLLTIADADCIFHPAYFGHVLSDYWKLRQQNDGQHFWTMWQAPKLPFRHYYNTSAISRVLAYMNAVCEFGGVSGLLIGGQHLPHSAYTLPLQLALNASAWEGDVVTEDHHCFMKCFFFSLYVAATSSSSSPGAIEGHAGTVPGGDCIGRGDCHLQLRPVFLPIKSTSIRAADNMKQVHAEAWQQARRRAQGVAEISYCILAAFDFARTSPRTRFNIELFWRMVKIVLSLMFNHIVPICQSTALAFLSMRWTLHGRVLDTCPLVPGLWHGFWSFNASHALLCDLAGARLPVIPMLLPLALLVVASYLCLFVVFLRPAEKRLEVPSRWTIWDAEDGNVPRSTSGESYAHASLLRTLFLDFSVFMCPLMFPYGLLVELAAYWGVCFNGNRLKYAASVPAKSLGYGALSAFGPPKKF